MSSIKLKHSGGNGVSITAPDTNPSSDRTLKLPSTDADGLITTKDSNDSLQSVSGINGGQISNRNLVMNGAMRIDQRNDGSAVTVPNGNATFITDRFKIFEDTDGVVTGQRVADAPVGFFSSLKIDCTTADTSLSASQRLICAYRIEGSDFEHLNFGTANAKTMTLSFYVKSNLTGTFGGVVKNSGDNRVYIFSYSISSANTWERKSVTIAGDTGGTWLVGNNTGLTINWGLALGSNWVSSAGNWGTTDRHGVTGQQNLLSSTSNEWLLTGVQLEEGSVATSFEHKFIGQDLQDCQRYYQIVRGATRNDYRSNNRARTGNNMNYFTEMRANPTASTFATVASQNMDSVTYERVNKRGLNFTAVGIVTVGGTDGQELINDVQLSAEL